MKKIINFALVLLSLFLISSIFVSNCFASGTDNFFKNDLGVMLDESFTNDELSSLSIGTVFNGVIIDPTKMGGCNVGDKLEIIKSDENTYQLRHLKTNQYVIAKTNYNQGKVTVNKIDSTYGNSSHRNYPKFNSVMIKLGAYDSDSDLEDVDTGFFNQVTYNRYFNNNFAFEVGGGSFFTSATGEFEDAYGNKMNVSGDIYVYNVLFNLKFIVPFQFGEIYGGAGPSIYFVYGDDDGTYSYVDDNDTVFGGQIVAGINFNVNQHVFLGFEGQYIFTGDIEFGDNRYTKEFNLNGYNISGVLGFRF